LVGDIFGEAHGTGPIGSREAAGSVFAAPNSLRTIVA
jgi:hypothetical protein